MARSYPNYQELICESISSSIQISSSEDEALHVVLVPPLFQQLLESDPAGTIRSEQRPRRFHLAFISEIAGRAFALELRGIEHYFREVPDVRVLGLLCRLDGFDTALQRLA